jgi:Protein of unknown function (DUF2490)
MSKKGILSFLMAIIFTASLAQTKDFQVWPNIYLEAGVNKRVNVHINQQTRFGNNVSQFQLAYGDGGFGYRITKFMLINLDYVYVRRREFVDKHEDQQIFGSRHQFYTSVVLKKEMHRYRITYRGMLQGQFKDAYSSKRGVFPQYYFRNKLTARYFLNKYFTPYIASELYYNFNTKGHNGFNRARYFVGLFYNLGNKSAIELYYLIQQPLIMKANTPFVFVLGIGFSNNISWAGNANN